jgi:hypothetical protein
VRRRNVTASEISYLNLIRNIVVCPLMAGFICDVIFPISVLVRGVHLVMLYEMMIIYVILHNLIAQSLGRYHPSNINRNRWCYSHINLYHLAPPIASIDSVAYRAIIALQAHNQIFRNHIAREFERSEPCPEMALNSDLSL